LKVVPKIGAIVPILGVIPKAKKILSTLSGKTQLSIFLLNFSCNGGMNYSESQVMGDGQ
jgi:hypothetical protein